MKTLLLALKDDGQIEALNAAIKERIENLDDNIDCLDHDDPGEADNIEAFVSERDALEAVLESLGEAFEGKALVVVEKGLVQSAYATVELEVEVWDMDVEDDDRDDDVITYIDEHRMVKVY